MTPILFGPATRRLMGLYHEPAAVPGGQGKAAVLLCQPFGHEAIRVHRLFRVLAERLSRLGHAVLRFDCYGTGDSPGDDEDADLEGWRDDVLQAHTELLRRAGSSEVRWMGARLGGTSAVQAAALRPAALRQLLLWDPIVDGRAYARLLREKHVEALELTYCIPDPTWRRALAADVDAPPSEAIGFAVSATLGRQLRDLQPSSMTVAPGVQVQVLHRADDLAVTAWSASQRAVAEVLDHGVVWTADPQINDAVVPNDVLQRLLRALDSQS